MFGKEILESENRLYSLLFGGVECMLAGQDRLLSLSFFDPFSSVGNSEDDFKTD